MTETAVTTDQRLLFPTILDLRAAHRELLKQQRHGMVDSKIVENFVARARSTGIRLYRDTDREVAQSVIDYWIAALYRSRVDTKDATLEAFDEKQAREESTQSPYLGLSPFTENDSDRFFGRGALINVIRTRMESERLFILIGQSGTGKSSLVRGGLIPKLRKGAIAGSDAWRYYEPIVPGSEPLASLARLFRPKDTVVPDEWLPAQVKKLLDSPRYLHTALTVPGGAPAFIVIDQLEEIFTLCADMRVRRAFAANLVHLAKAEGPRHTVVLTVRSDYEPHLLKLPEIEPLLRHVEVRVGPLNESELREVIERPAEVAGLLFENGLVDRIVADVRDEPAALPLLQFTLRRLWSERDDRNRLTWAEYDRLHGALYALGTVADEVFNDLSLQAQQCARRIFLRIIRTSAVGGVKEARPTLVIEKMSRRVRKTDAIAGEVVEEAEAVLAKLIDAGLLRATAGDTPASVQIEVAHEALIRNWGTLQSWIDQENVQIVQRDRLEIAAQEWIETGAGLLDEVQLRDALAWQKDADTRAFGVSQQVRDFIRASETEIRKVKRVTRVFGAGFVAAVIIALAVAWGLERTMRDEAAAKARVMTGQLALADAQRAAKDAEIKRLLAQKEWDQFLLKNPNEQIRELKTIIEELEAKNAELSAEIQRHLTTPPSRVVLDTAIQQKLVETIRRSHVLRGQVSALEDETSGQKELIERLTRDNADQEEQIRALRAAAAPKTPPEILRNENLQILDLVGSMHNDAAPAAICCLLKGENGSHYAVTTGAAVGAKAEPGDLVVRHSPGAQHRIGVVWWKNPKLDSAVILLFPGVGTEDKLPPLEPGAKRKNIGGTTWFDSKGDKVSVVSRRGVFEATLTSVTPDEMVMAFKGEQSDVGAPVVNSLRSLVGYIVKVGPDTATVTSIRPVLNATKLDLD